jgi:hypothetical protein
MTGVCEVPVETCTDSPLRRRLGAIAVRLGCGFAQHPEALT